MHRRCDVRQEPFVDLEVDQIRQEEDRDARGVDEPELHAPPIAAASAAAHNRRARSSSTGASTAYFATIETSRSVSRLTRLLDHETAEDAKIILARGLSTGDRR